MGSYISSSYRSVENTANSLIFHPSKSSFEDFDNTYNDIKFITSTNGNKICLVHLYPTHKSEKYLIWCHGNSGDLLHISNYLEHLCNKLNVHVIAFDYQGYGLSEGFPSEERCYDDLKNVVSYVTTLGVLNENIYLFGHSLGTGVVVDYASTYNWKTPIVLISPYKTMAKVMVDSSCIDTTSNSINYCSGKHVDKFRSEAKIQNVICPVKIFHGGNDQLINISHGMKLYELLQDKTFKPIWIDGATHNNILGMINLHDFKDVINSII